MTLPWTIIIWSLTAGSLLTVGAIHFGIWRRKRSDRAQLAFAAFGASLALVVVGEMLMMQAQTPEQFGTILRWLHLPGLAAIVSVAVFIRIYLRGGRLWLAYGACGLRLLAVLLNFQLDPNVNYQSISGLEKIELFGGEKVSIAVGVVSPWNSIAALSLLALVVFILDATVECWRRGDATDRRRALTVGGGFAAFVAIAAGNTWLIHQGFIQSIYLHGVIALAVVGVVRFELNADASREAKLADQLRGSEDALRRSEQRLKLAADAGRLGIWEWDVVRDEYWMTGQTRALLGFADSERVTFERVLSVLHPEDRAAVRQDVERCLSEGTHYEREFRVPLPQGRVRWIATRGGIEKDPDGNSVRVRGVALDITERKEADERFQRVVEAAPIGMIFLSPDGTIAMVNHRVEQDFGYAREELVGHHVEMLIQERLRGRHAMDRTAYSANPAARMMANREVAGRRKDGSEVPLEIGLSPIQGLDGPGVLATIVDVSDRKRRDELLRNEREFLRQVIDITPNLIFAKDREGRFTLVNKAVAELYGTTVDNLIGKTDADFNKDAEQVEAFRLADLEVMDTLTERTIFEERITDAAGNDHWLQTTKRPIVSGDGATSQVLGSATDITSIKKSEHELARLRNELAHFARVTMLSELSGSLAHELNQPLTAILSNAQAALQFLAQEPADLDEVREILQDIATDNKRAGDVIKGLRMLLKRGEMRREVLDVNDIARDVLRLVRSDMLNAGVALTTALTPGLPAVQGDRAQLQQVLLNLVVNGCDAMAGKPAAERRLAVFAEPDGEDGIRVRVHDQGHGLPPDDFERVFEPFFTTKPQGLGLGLSVCRTIITAHGGRLWGANNSGGGATFTFTLPVSPDSMP